MLTVDFKDPRLVKRDLKNWRRRLGAATDAHIPVSFVFTHFKGENDKSVFFENLSGSDFFPRHVMVFLGFSGMCIDVYNRQHLLGITCAGGELCGSYWLWQVILALELDGP